MSGFRPTNKQINDLIHDSVDGGPAAFPSDWDAAYIRETIEAAAARAGVIVDLQIDVSEFESVLMIEDLVVLT